MSASLFDRDGRVPPTLTDGYFTKYARYGRYGRKVQGISVAIYGGAHYIKVNFDIFIDFLFRNQPAPNVSKGWLIVLLALAIG